MLSEFFRTLQLDRSLEPQVAYREVLTFIISVLQVKHRVDDPLLVSACSPFSELMNQFYHGDKSALRFVVSEPADFFECQG